jgi:hypothetical protein
MHAGRYSECSQVLNEAAFFEGTASTSLSAYSSRVTFYIAAYRTVDILLNLAGIQVGLRSGEDRPLLAREMAEGAFAVVSDVLHKKHNGEPGNLAVALVNLASARLALEAEPSQSLFLGNLEDSVEEIRIVGQRPWIIESNLVKCRAFRSAHAVPSSLAGLDVAERLSSSDGMILQSIACQIERVLIDQEVSGLPIDTTSLSQIAASAARLGLAFLEDSALSLSRLSR